MGQLVFMGLSSLPPLMLWRLTVCLSLHTTHLLILPRLNLLCSLVPLTMGLLLWVLGVLHPHLIDFLCPTSMLEV